MTICEHFQTQCIEECVLQTLDRVQDQETDAVVLFLDEETGRIYRVLDATRGSPDSGWFVLALGSTDPVESFVRQRRINDTDVHHVCIVEEGTDTAPCKTNRDPSNSEEQA